MQWGMRIRCGDTRLGTRSGSLRSCRSEAGCRVARREAELSVLAGSALQSRRADGDFRRGQQVVRIDV